LLSLFMLLAAFNLAGWAAALALFHGRPLLMAAAFLAYSFGLRHAFDMDHIAAIDNVTRKLMQNGDRPLLVGLYFSLGHSSIVLALTLLIALAAGGVRRHFAGLQDIGGLIGTSVSAGFLIVIALVNMVVLFSVWHAIRRARGGAQEQFSQGGAALLRKLLRLIGRSWHMVPLGMLFGLSFDTATEIGLLGLSATQAARGLSAWTLLIFPVLFAAAMSLMDSIDGVVMLGAYDWALVKPMRRLYYNFTITALSVGVALAAACIEVTKLATERLGLPGPVWKNVGALGDKFSLLGLWVAGLLLASWLLAIAFSRLRPNDRSVP
jgi:high-affinity nickel-transport protein